MEFKVLLEEEFKQFADNYPQASFMQTVELAHLKEEYGSNIHYVGVLENDKLVAGSVILEDKTFLSQKMFYAPRGLLVDYHNKKLLSFFTDELKKYIKKQGGFIFTMDPNVVYRTRTSEGNLTEEYSPDKDSINNLLELGYNHHGFNIYLDALQARWAYRMPLDEDYEIKKSKFSKSTRKNIDSCIKKGLQVREGTIDDLETMTEIFELTSKRKDFFSRSLSYYQKMYKHMKDLMTIYIAYLDPEVYYQHTKELLDSELKVNLELECKMEHDNVGNKLLKKKETSDKLIGKYRIELEKATKFKEDYPKGKDIGCLLSLRSGCEYLTLSSGVLEEYKSFTPKYLMYEHHIKEAYKEGFKYCNFYGITGDFDPNNKYYGIYEFKKGFNGNVIEYIGQFELKITKFYSIYKLLKKVKDKIKR
ncbi:MAG: aminoacyltransferase [Firmicutes bacterium]|nr:aminoacyltransferase [Bacillota bacterium]